MNLNADSNASDLDDSDDTDYSGSFFTSSTNQFNTTNVGLSEGGSDESL